ncbi:MAG TPA: 5'/3'-nucleotidase SurE [Acidimicrobiia bacterium]|jgi:5'-nucleotidase
MTNTQEPGSRTERMVVEEAVTPTSPRPRLLLTNDDGIQSEGIRTLASKFVEHDYDVVVAAPATDMSGSGTGIGRWDSQKGIDLKRAGWKGIEAYTIAGPPGLAVMAGSLGAFGPSPNLVVSGINAGRNTGHSVLHSGTVGAVLTARTFGSHGLAVSLDYAGTWYWDNAAEAALKAARWILDQHKARIVLNLNVPGVEVSEIQGTRWADLDNFGYFRVATADFTGERLQFEVGGSGAGENPACDTYLCNNNFITMTPLSTIEPAPFPKVPAEQIVTLG